MRVRFRSTHQARFGRNATIGQILNLIIGPEVLGWTFDVSVHSEGVEIDTEGLTVHLVKTSDSQETLDEKDATMRGFRTPTR